jgi:ATP-dependent Clp protease adaptor protein ClpS
MDALFFSVLRPARLAHESAPLPRAHAPPDRDAETDVQQEEQLDEMLWVEPPYRVLIHNDDVTTFEFVIDMLQKIFRLTYTQAEQVAIATHVVGIAFVCVRPQGEAEQLVNKAIFAARIEGFPLMLTCEPDAGFASG